MLAVTIRPNAQIQYTDTHYRFVFICKNYDVNTDSEVHNGSEATTDADITVAN